MTETSVLFDQQGHTATITLNRPESLNSFTANMHRDLSACIDRVKADPAIGVVILTGSGKAFSSGQNLKERADMLASGTPVDLGTSLEANFNPLIRYLTEAPVLVISAINGVAAGAGASLALAGDVILAGESARLIFSFIKVGLIPDAGGSWILPRLIGYPRAIDLALTGRSLDAKSAAEWGLVSRVVADDQLMPTARALADTFSDAPREALIKTKQIMRTAFQSDLPTQLEKERDTQRTLGLTDNYREGVSAFLEKRVPQFNRSAAE